MNIEQIRQLAVICRENDLSAVELCEEGVRIRLERRAEGALPAPKEERPAFDPAKEPARGAEPGLAPEREIDFNRVVEVKSPLVGVYYEAPAPDAPPFVKVGDRVKKGQALCIVEAMKMMNEIVAPQDGEIVDVCLAHGGEVVEFGQTLFKLC